MPAAPSEQLWQIPLFVSQGDQIEPERILVTERTQLIVIQTHGWWAGFFFGCFFFLFQIVVHIYYLMTTASGSYVKFNAGHASVCRVNYSPELWSQLAAVLPSLPASDRLGLVSGN